MKFYKCEICGQIIMVVKETGVPVVCCGEDMKEILPGTVDASLEKHVPVAVNKSGKIEVVVGSSLHPMTEDHYIEWIALKTKKGIQMKYLNAGDEPRTDFELCDEDEAETVFAYCNLHELWKTDHISKG